MLLMNKPHRVMARYGILLGATCATHCYHCRFAKENIRQQIQMWPIVTYWQRWPQNPYTVARLCMVPPPNISNSLRSCVVIHRVKVSHVGFLSKEWQLSYQPHPLQQKIPTPHTWTEIRLNPTWVCLESKHAMRTSYLGASKWAPTSLRVCRLTPPSL